VLLYNSWLGCTYWRLLQHLWVVCDWYICLYVGRFEHTRIDISVDCRGCTQGSARFPTLVLSLLCVVFSKS